MILSGDVKQLEQREVKIGFWDEWNIYLILLFGGGEYNHIANRN